MYLTYSLVPIVSLLLTRNITLYKERRTNIVAKGTGQMVPKCKRMKNVNSKGNLVE